MKKLIAVACLGFVFVASTPAFAITQQQKMKGCGMEAKGMKGAERKEFMSKCLKKDFALKPETEAAIMKQKAAAPASDPAGVASAPTTASADQQGKMKACSADAKSKGLKGVERRKFMSSCLKG